MADQQTTAWAVIAEDDYEYGAELIGIVAGCPDAIAAHLLALAREYADTLDAKQWPAKVIRPEPDESEDERRVYLDLGITSGRTWVAKRFKVEVVHG